MSDVLHFIGEVDKFFVEFYELAPGGNLFDGGMVQGVEVKGHVHLVFGLKLIETDLGLAILGNQLFPDFFGEN